MSRDDISIFSQLHDPALVIYVYESSVGVGLVILRCIAWVWFLYASIFTLKNYPEKRKFYIPFLVFYSFWSVYLHVHVHDCTRHRNIRMLKLIL